MGNLITTVRSRSRYCLGITKQGTFIRPVEYKLAFSDTFTNLNQWEPGSQWWEQPYHPGIPTSWYDDDQIKIVTNGVEFSAVVKPRYFPEIDTTIPNAIGNIRSILGWKYGMFFFKCKLPSGKYLWPALWTSGLKHWPPEIDLLECYSEDTVDYHKGKRLSSNVHITDGQGGSIDVGAKDHWLPNKVTEEFVDYIVWWEKDFIRFYYNRYLVREITDREFLDGMSEEQQIILGTGVQEGFLTNNLSPMIVNAVGVWQKA